MNNENVTGVMETQPSAGEGRPAQADAAESKPVPGPFDSSVLMAEYHELAAAYGDAKNRLRGLEKFIADTEAKLDAMELMFARAAAGAKRG